MHVMLVDDHEGILLLLKKILYQYNHTVVIFSNGADALEYVHEEGHRIDLIISDFHMPNFDGLEFCQEVKNIPEYKALPFIFISSETSDEIKERAFLLGAVSFVNKPIDARALISLLDALIPH
jgi:two-component system chemotaxis response regulator CheY